MCPDKCSTVAGDHCIFNDIQMFEHCPWDLNRNFNSFGNSLLQLFFITTGDNDWISILINGMRSNDTIAYGLIFFVIFFLVSYGFLYSTLIVVIIMAFDPEDKQKIQMQKSELRERVFRAISRAAELAKQGFKTPKRQTGARRTSIYTHFNVESGAAEESPVQLTGNSPVQSTGNRTSLQIARKASSASPSSKRRRSSAKRKSTAGTGGRHSSYASGRRTSITSNALDLEQIQEDKLQSLRAALRSKLSNKDIDIEDAYKELRACQLQDYFDGKFDLDADKPILWGRLLAPAEGNLRW